MSRPPQPSASVTRPGDLLFVEDGLSLGLPVATYMKCERCGVWDE